MDLLVRSTIEEDLQACTLIMDDAFVYRLGERAQLLAMLRQFLRAKCAVTAVAEDLQRPAGSRMMGFGLGVFVNDEFALETQSLSPYLSQHVLRLWLSDRSPVLTVDEIRLANRHDGLNWLSLHVTSGRHLGLEAEAGQLRDKMVQVLFQLLAGYQLKSATQEVYGVQHRQVFTTFGMRLVNNHDGFSARPTSSASYELISEQHPYLFAITREEARDEKHEGTYVRALFNYTPPRFDFHPVEQELLVEALSDATDREIANSLCRSVETIKKQWLRIYEKVLATDNTFFADDVSSNLDKPTRGLEKKRVLLKYLRRHPEELRPH